MVFEACRRWHEGLQTQTLAQHSVCEAKTFDPLEQAGFPDSRVSISVEKLDFFISGG